MKCTWGMTNRMYAIARKSGDESQLAWVSHLRSKLTARRNRRAGHAPHDRKHDVPAGAHSEPQRADVRHGPSVGLPLRSVRAGAHAQAPTEDHSRDPAHELRQYQAASGLIAHFADVLPAENLAELRAIKDQLEARQPANEVKRAVNESLRRW